MKNSCKLYPIVDRTRMVDEGDDRMKAYWKDRPLISMDVSRARDEHVRMVPNTPTKRCLRITHVTRGRSALHFHLLDDNTGEEYIGGQQCFEAMLAHGIQHNCVSSWWWVFKRGSSYLISPVKETDFS